MSHVAALQDAIRKLHGCESDHVFSEQVTERFQGQTVWEGVVETFVLRDHPKAMKCHAWNHATDDGGSRVVTVLELPPVDSARKAVQVAIAAESREVRS
jgi:hypothetical protein